MKSIILSCMAVLCLLNANALSQPKIRIGHRNAAQAAVLDISIATVQPAVIQSLQELHFTNIRVVSLDISDNAFNPFYYASMGISVTFQEPGNPDLFKITYLYPLVYDASANAYYGGEADLGRIQNGNGLDKNPDNNFCVARNCVGCPTLRDINGKTMGCGICTPTGENPYSCVVENTAGLGGSRIITAIGGIIKGLLGLL